MSELAVSHIPSICISPAPPEEPVVEPYSPFSNCSTPTVDQVDSFRPNLLTPPPTSSHFPRQLSPLRPADAPVKGKGLERERFEALLKASRERNAALGSKKPVDLRKEIALKAHKNKQVERRALFLSKVLAPPSPSATFTPKTPPESPAIFHYSLPSPGLESPLALFESLNESAAKGDSVVIREPWVEQVDFRLPDEILKERGEKRHAPHPILSPVSSARRINKILPSLDQISARLASQGHVSQPVVEERAAARPGRLPAFLANRSNPKANTNVEPHAVPTTTHSERPPLAGVGRLKAPIRAPQPIKPEENPRCLPPKSPMSLLPKIQITTQVVPRTNSNSPTELSESNLLALDSRERRAQDMLFTLRRRTLPSEQEINGHEDSPDDRKSKWKRHSAPADLYPLRPRIGFEHPVLSMPGGF